MAAAWRWASSSKEDDLRPRTELLGHLDGRIRSSSGWLIVASTPREISLAMTSFDLRLSFSASSLTVTPSESVISAREPGGRSFGSGREPGGPGGPVFASCFLASLLRAAGTSGPRRRSGRPVRGVADAGPARLARRRPGAVAAPGLGRVSTDGCGNAPCRERRGACAHPECRARRGAHSRWRRHGFRAWQAREPFGGRLGRRLGPAKAARSFAVDGSAGSSSGG